MEVNPAKHNVMIYMKNIKALLITVIVVKLCIQHRITRKVRKF